MLSLKKQLHTGTSSARYVSLSGLLNSRRHVNTYPIGSNSCDFSAATLQQAETEFCFSNLLLFHSNFIVSCSDFRAYLH